MDKEKEMQKLERMIGNTYLFEGRRMLIQDVKINGNKARLITDKDEIELPLDALEDYLPDFHLKESNALARNPEVVEVILGGTTMYTKLQDTLLDTLQRIQADPGYIGQASAINDTIKSMIDLEKVKIQTLSLLK